MGYVYLVLLSSPLGSDRHQARFYLGSALNLDKRIRQHRSGQGSAMLRAANQKGIDYEIIKSLQLPTAAAARKLERRLKRRKRNAELLELDWTRFID